MNKEEEREVKKLGKALRDLDEGLSKLESFGQALIKMNEENSRELMGMANALLDSFEETDERVGLRGLLAEIQGCNIPEKYPHIQEQVEGLVKRYDSAYRVIADKYELGRK